MLLAILMKAMMASDRSAELVDVVPALRRALGFLAPAVASMQLFDELVVCLVAVLTFGVILRTLLPALFPIVHLDLGVGEPRESGHEWNRQPAARIPNAGKGRATLSSNPSGDFKVKNRGWPTRLCFGVVSRAVSTSSARHVANARYASVVIDGASRDSVRAVRLGDVVAARFVANACDSW
jgi:hypothetical protein